MRDVSTWLQEYSKHHRHPVNERIHWICIPVILVALLVLLSLLRWPGIAWLNAATALCASSWAYYVALSPRLALGMLAVLALASLCVLLLLSLPVPPAYSAGALFTAGWIGQFAGHRLEGKRPSFLQDVRFLLIGPLWLLAALYRRWNVRY